MSDNPFQDSPVPNPYAPPSFPPPPQSNPLTAPGVILLVLSILFLLVLIASLPRTLLQLRGLDASTPQGSGEMLGTIVTPIAWMLATYTILLGSISMIRLQKYSMAVAAAVLAVIPICSPCFVLGMPFGVWAIVLLRRPEVKSRFRS